MEKYVPPLEQINFLHQSNHPLSYEHVFVCVCGCEREREDSIFFTDQLEILISLANRLCYTSNTSIGFRLQNWWF